MVLHNFSARIQYIIHSLSELSALCQGTLTYTNNHPLALVHTQYYTGITLHTFQMRLSCESIVRGYRGLRSRYQLTYSKFWWIIHKGLSLKDITLFYLSSFCLCMSSRLLLHGVCYIKSHPPYRLSLRLNSHLLQMQPNSFYFASVPYFYLKQDKERFYLV